MTVLYGVVNNGGGSGGGTPTGNAGGDLSGTYPNPSVSQAQSGAIKFGSNGLITLAAADNDGGIYQVPPSVAATPSNLVLIPQASSTASGTQAQNTPGSVVVSLSAPGSVGTAGSESFFTVQRASTTLAQIGGYTGAPSSYGALYLGPGITPGAGNYTILGGSVTQFNGQSGCELQVGGNNVLGITSTAITPNVGPLTWSSGVAPTVSQTAPASVSTPANFTISPQAPNGGSGTQAQNTPGSLVVSLSAPGSVGTAGNEAAFTVQRAGTTIASIQGVPTAVTTRTGLWLSTPTITSTNATIEEDTSGNVQINAGGTFVLSSSSNVSITSGSTAMTLFSGSGNIQVATNWGLFLGASPSRGSGGGGMISMGACATVPSTNPTSGMILYSTGSNSYIRGGLGALTTVGPAGSSGTISSQAQIIDTQIGTVETVSSATATAILAYSTVSGAGGIINMQIVSRATTTGTGVVIGNTAAANYTLTFSNIAGTVALSTAGITLVGTAQTTNSTFTAPVLTATIATNVITIKVSNVALCTVDSQLVADIVLC